MRLNTNLFLLNYLWNLALFKDWLCVIQSSLKYVKSVGSPSATLIAKREFLILLGYGSGRSLRGHGWDASTRSLWKVCFNWLCYFKSRKGGIGSRLPQQCHTSPSVPLFSCGTGPTTSVIMPRTPWSNSIISSKGKHLLYKWERGWYKKSSSQNVLWPIFQVFN